MTQHPPVTDFATDFDHTDPQWVDRPVPDLGRAAREVPGRAHRPLRRRVAAGDATTTSPRSRTTPSTSRRARSIVSEVRPDENDLPAPIGIAPPITSDPPFHQLRPPAAAARVRAEADRRARAVHARAVQRAARRDRRARPTFDAAVDYAQHIPRARHREDARLPAGGRRHLPPLHPHDHRGRRHAGRGAPARSQEQGELDAYLDARIEEHLAHPRDDLTSFLLDAEIDGQKLATRPRRAARWCC